MANQPVVVGADGKWVVHTVHDGAPREWKNKRGDDMLSYRIDVIREGVAPADAKVGETGFKRVELAQKKSTAAPKAGDVLDGKINQREYESGGQTKTDLKFDKAYGGGRGGGGGRAWKPRPDDSPLVYASRQAGIIRQHSQNMALRVMELAAQTDNGDWSGIMADLGIETTVKIVQPDESVKEEPLGLVEAFTRDVSLAAGAAWTREEEKHRIADALKAIS